MSRDNEETLGVAPTPHVPCQSSEIDPTQRVNSRDIDQMAQMLSRENRRLPDGLYKFNKDKNGNLISIVDVSEETMVDMKKANMQMNVMEKNDLTTNINKKKKVVPSKNSLKKRFWKWYYTK
ncbi:hypothetical protein M7I_7544 [Glarea lozoyensis 74030]|nr:hypothetical protein M7I_7544 [Glarea lozoyensis 74030]